MYFLKLLFLRILAPLEQKLESVMVSQKSPIHSVAAAIRRRQNGWHDEDKPLVMLFLVDLVHFSSLPLFRAVVV